MEHTLMNHASSTPAAAPTPLADALLKARSAVPLQFQSLPLAGGASALKAEGPHAEVHAQRYRELFGATFLATESLVAGLAFDSFFFPERVIRESERLAAEAFGSQDAMFVTSGTTVANQIAINALVPSGARVLADRQCHQSVHFALHAAGARVDYLEPVYECDATGRAWWGLQDLLDRVQAAQAEDQPYHLLLLNGQSYDGVMYDFGGILAALQAAGLRVANLLVDEAWGSAACFDPALSQRGAMPAARRYAQAMELNIVATHSVHKSMGALRQGSMLLWHGDAALGERLRLSRYKLHTTSPSYPILASLDLARAQMVDCGAALMARAQRLAQRLQDAIAEDPTLSLYGVHRTALPAQVARYVGLDPTKVAIDVTRLGLPAAELKRKLYSEHGLWVNRCTPRSVLFNLHIGIDDAALDQLLQALRAVQHEVWAERARPAASLRLSDAFVIAYPPGIPIVMPGEPLTASAQGRIEAARRAGASVFTIAH
jgi:arginine/lysine/ornithine decarboxylase